MNSSYLKLKEDLDHLKLHQMILRLDETIDFMNQDELSFIETLIILHRRLSEAVIFEFTSAI